MKSSPLALLLLASLGLPGCIIVIEQAKDKKDPPAATTPAEKAAAAAPQKVKSDTK